MSDREFIDMIPGPVPPSNAAELIRLRGLFSLMAEFGVTELKGCGDYNQITIVRPLSLPVPRVLTNEEKLDEHEKKRKGTFLEAVAGSEGFKDFENTGTVGR